MRRILQKAHTLIGEIKEDDRRAKHRACADDLYVQDIRDPHQQEDQNLAADALKAHLAGQLFVRYGAHHASDIINGDKDHQGDEQAVTPSQEPAEPAANGGKYHLDHSKILSLPLPPFHFLYAKRAPA